MSDIGKQIDNLEDKVNWHWRYSMQPVRFVMFDARAAIPLPFLLIYFRPSTLIITAAFLIFFNILERRGLSFPAAMRAFRVMIIGPHRPRLISVLKNKFVDYK